MLVNKNHSANLVHVVLWELVFNLVKGHKKARFWIMISGESIPQVCGNLALFLKQAIQDGMRWIISKRLASISRYRLSALIMVACDRDRYQYHLHSLPA